jgi:dCTP deaminase
MYLSNRDIRWAIESGNLIVDPRPEHFNAGYDETSIDLHLDKVEEAKVWNISLFKEQILVHGETRPELRIGQFHWAEFSELYLKAPPAEDGTGSQPVSRRGNQILVRTGGFLLWTTKEKVGTPRANAQFISFVNAKSTRARTGIMVHFTAPTIHAGWSGKIVLEIANLGPFDIVLQEEDVIAQLTVAAISSPPDPTLRQERSQTNQQEHVGGRPKRKKRRRP